MFFEKLRKIHSKMLLMESLLEKFQTLRPAVLLKIDSNKFSCEFCGVFNNIYFLEYLQRLLLNKLCIRCVYSFLSSM